uniref:Uncharacterized protein n=1 Tax=Strigamia maritima TaxID=126957 RepID=T1JNA2_STRMM
MSGNVFEMQRFEFGYKYSCCSSNDYQPVPTRFETSDRHVDNLKEEFSDKHTRI